MWEREHIVLGHCRWAGVKANLRMAKTCTELELHMFAVGWIWLSTCWAWVPTAAAVAAVAVDQKICWPSRETVRSEFDTDRTNDELVRLRPKELPLHQKIESLTWWILSATYSVAANAIECYVLEEMRAADESPEEVSGKGNWLNSDEDVVMEEEAQKTMVRSGKIYIEYGFGTTRLICSSQYERRHENVTISKSSNI